MMKSLHVKWSFLPSLQGLFATATLLLLMMGNLNAQVSTSYTFSSTSGNYIPITGGHKWALDTVANGASWDDDAYFLDSIGFQFYYNGRSFNQFWVNTNGFIKLGDQNTPPSSTYYLGPPVSLNDNCISAFANDLMGQGQTRTTSELRVEVIGTAPYRVCVIQFRDWSAFPGDGTTANERYNFQIRLNENDGNGFPEIVYGGFNTSLYTTTGSRPVQAGMSGATVSDYNLRTATSGWATSTAGTVNTAAMQFFTTSMPDSGRTYTWTIPAAPMTIDSVSTVQVTSGAIQGTTLNPVIAAVVYTRGNTNRRNITQITFNTTGTTAVGNISNARVWYTGTSNTFSGIIAQFGSTIASPSGTMTFTDNDTLDPGPNYFWLTYDVSGTAPLGNFIDAQCTNVRDSSTINYTPNTVAPAGARKIILPMNGNYTINPAGGSTSTNFTSIDNALLALADNGISGPVKFTISAGTYTVTSPVTINAVIGASTSRTVTFEGVNPATTIITGNLSSLPVIYLNYCKYVILRNLTVTNTATGACAGIAIMGSQSSNAGTGCGIKSCIVNLPGAGTNNATACVGMTVAANGATFSTSVLMDSVQIDSNTLNGGYYGIGIFGALNSNYNRGLKIRNNTINSYYYGFYANYVHHALDVMNNVITNISAGIYLTNCNNSSAFSHRIMNNRITGFTLYGIYMTAPGSNASIPVKIHNNFVSSSISAVTYGIYMSGASSYYEAYHNTSIFNVGNATATYAPMYYTATGTSNAFIRNNILFNNATTGSNTCLHLAANPTGNVVNGNNYFNRANTSLLNRGATAYTSGTYLTVTAGGDSSFNVMPSFASAGDYHLADGCQPKGLDLTSVVPTDLEGNTRSATPHVGCDEQIIVSNDIAVQVITSPLSPYTVGAQDITFRVKNTGNNAITSFSISYSNNGGTVQSQTWTTGTLNPCDTTSVVFTGSQQVTLAGVNDILVYTSAPNSSTDANKNNDTLRATLFAPLSGTYTIAPSGANFNSFTAAIGTMMSAGIVGPVVFNVGAGNYNEQVRINGAIPGASSVNTVTFDGGNGNAATRVITGSASGTGIASQGSVVITNSKYITLRNLTVNNMASTAPCGIALVGSASSGIGGCNTVSNCVINVTVFGGTSTAGYGINATATANGNGISAQGGDSIVIDSNIINGGAYGIVTYGQSSPSYNRGIKVRYNTTNNTNYMGAYVAYNYNATEALYNTFNMAQNYGTYGLYFYSNQNGSTTVPNQVIGNRINHAGSYGIYMYYPASSTTTAPTKFYNNTIWMGGSVTYPGIYGIYLTLGVSAVVEVYHNTVYMSGLTTANTNACFYNANTTSNILVKNNTFVVGAGMATPMYQATSITAGNTNYNNYYNYANPTTGNLVYRAGFYTPGTYRTTAAGGDSSFNQPPMFAQMAIPSDVHVTNPCTPRGVDLTGLIPTDIDGHTRSVPPQVGADEYAMSGLDLTTEAVAAPSYPVAAGTQDVVVRVRNNGSTPVTSFNIAYRYNGGAAVTKAWTGTLNPCDTVSVVFTGSQQINVTASANNTLMAYTSAPNASADAIPANDTLNVSFGAPLNGTYTIGATASDFTSFNAALTALSVRGVSGPVLFNVRTGTYNEKIEFANYAGVSAVNNITFTSLANNRDSVTISYTSSNVLHDNFVIRYYNAQNITLRNLTVSQLNNTFSGHYTIWMTGNISNDTIEGCRLMSPAYTSFTNYVLYGSPVTGNNLVLKSNTFQGGYYGVYFYGVGTTNTYSNFTFNNNTVQGVYYYPMQAYYHTGMQCRNNVFTLNGTGPTNYNYFYYHTNSMFVNNVVNVASNITTFYFYLFLGGNGCGVYNNTFNSSHTAGYGPCIYNSVANGIDVRNNIFRNNSTGYAMTYYYGPSTTYMVNADFNNYFTTGATLINQVSAATTYPTLQAWRAAFPTLDKNSITYRPGFMSTTNGAPNPADSAVWAINGRGVHIASVPTDINGAARPATVAAGVPDMGAYEVTPTVAPPMAVAVPATPSAGTTQSFLFGGDTIARIAWDAFATPPSFVEARLYSGNIPPEVGTAPVYSLNAYWDITAPAGTYNYNITLKYKDAWLGNLPNEANMIMAQKSTGLPWAIHYSSVTDSAANTMFMNALNQFSYFAGTDATSPLPVQLLDLTAKRADAGVLLSWATASEHNSSRFEVQRSLNGTDFSTIGSVAAAGTALDARSYGFTDREALATGAPVIYYRLNMVDADGKAELSKVVKVLMDRDRGFEAVNVFPNPFTSQLAVSITSAENAHINWQLADMQGRTLAQSAADIHAGTSTINLGNLSSLDHGVYFLTIGSSTGQNQVIKVLK